MADQIAQRSLSVDLETPLGGLSEAEAEKRLKARPPIKPPVSSRSYASIVRGNVFEREGIRLDLFRGELFL